MLTLLSGFPSLCCFILSMRAFACHATAPLTGIICGVQGLPTNHTLVPLLILLSQQMSIIAAKTESKDLKFIADQFDKCQQTMYQVRYLCSVLTPCRLFLCSSFLGSC